MKKMILASTLLVSTQAFADIDYSRCIQAMGIGHGIVIDNDGKVGPADFMTVKSRSTEGLIETVVLEMKDGFNKGYETKVTIERDEQGRIVRAGTGGDRPDKKTIEMWSQAYSNPYYGNWNSKVSEPVYNIDGKKVPLDKVTKEQAKKAGFDGSLDEFRKLKAQRRKDKKTLKSMNDVYKKIHAKADYVIPFGTEAEFDIKDGLCLVKNVSSKTYSTKTKEVTKQLTSSREGCEEVQKLYKKYETKLNECSNVQTALNNEYYENFYKKKLKDQGGMTGGYPGGIAGGYVGGYAGGYAGGMSGGMVGGYMSPGMGNLGLISGELSLCEYTYGVGPVQSFYPGTTGGYTGGSSEASKQ